MEFQFDKDKIKNELTIEQVHKFVEDLGGFPRPIQGNSFISQTICHNEIGEGGYHLYYYDNGSGGIFKCYTECNDSFDIFQLVQKVKLRENPNFTLPQAIRYVAGYFGYAPNTTEQNKELSEDLKIFNKYDKIKSIEVTKQQIELKTYNAEFLKNLPCPIIDPWVQEGITKEVMDFAGIRFDPLHNGIVIPHYDIEGNVIGVRERTLIKEDEVYGKYKPAIFNGKMMNHPLGLSLYGINWAKNPISKVKKAVVVEGEKSVLKGISYFGIDNDIFVAACGSNLISAQVEQLIKCGADEIVVCFDREGEKDNKANYVKKFYNFHDKYSSIVNISFMYDKDAKYLDYKMSPLDAGKDTFLKMYDERIFL